MIRLCGFHQVTSLPAFSEHGSRQVRAALFSWRFGLRRLLVAVLVIAIATVLLSNWSDLLIAIIPTTATSGYQVDANELLIESPPGSQLFLELRPSGRRFPCGAIHWLSGNRACRIKLVRRVSTLDVLDETQRVVLFSLQLLPEDSFTMRRGSYYSDTPGAAFQLFTIRSRATTESAAWLIVQSSGE